MNVIAEAEKCWQQPLCACQSEAKERKEMGRLFITQIIMLPASHSMWQGRKVSERLVGRELGKPCVSIHFIKMKVAMNDKELNVDEAETRVFRLLSIESVETINFSFHVSIFGFTFANHCFWLNAAASTSFQAINSFRIKLFPTTQLRYLWLPLNFHHHQRPSINSFDALNYINSVFKVVLSVFSGLSHAFSYIKSMEMVFINGHLRGNSIIP